MRDSVESMISENLVRHIYNQDEASSLELRAIFLVFNEQNSPCISREETKNRWGEVEKTKYDTSQKRKQFILYGNLKWINYLQRAEK